MGEKWISLRQCYQSRYFGAFLGICTVSATTCFLYLLTPERIQKRNCPFITPNITRLNRYKMSIPVVAVGRERWYTVM